MLGPKSFAESFIEKQSTANQLFLYDTCSHPNEDEKKSDAKGTTTLIHVILIDDKLEGGMIQKLIVHQGIPHSTAKQLAARKNLFSLNDNEWNQIKDHFPDAFGDLPSEVQSDFLQGNAVKHVRIPIVSENVVARMQNDASYCPEPLNLLKQFNVYKNDGTYISYPADAVAKLWRTRAPVPPFGMKLLRELNQALDQLPEPIEPLTLRLTEMNREMTGFLQFSGHGSRFTDTPNIHWEGPPAQTTNLSSASTNVQDPHFIRDVSFHKPTSYK